jgi:hypothetical protein
MDQEAISISTSKSEYGIGPHSWLPSLNVILEMVWLRKETELSKWPWLSDSTSEWPCTLEIWRDMWWLILSVGRRAMVDGCHRLRGREVGKNLGVVPSSLPLKGHCQISLLPRNKKITWSCKIGLS